MIKELQRILGGLLVISNIVSCSWNQGVENVPDQRLIYKKQREATENLEVPPDLTTGKFDDALDIPDINGKPTTFSEYSNQRDQSKQVNVNSDVLPQTPNVELKRRGEERWLVIQASPQQVWPRIIAFWREQGIVLTEQNPAVGVVRTDWLDNRAEIHKDFIQRLVSKVAAGLYATSTRDQYSIRIEEGTSAKTTELYLTHRGMIQKLVTSTLGDSERTVWEPSGTDVNKEAEMLRRLMNFLGAPKSSGASNITAAPTSVNSGIQVRLITEGNSAFLSLNQELREAWRLVSTALDRAGFAVEDRDQTRGLYFVRYAGEANARQSSLQGKKPSFWKRLAFWRKPSVDQLRQYQLKLTGDSHESRLTILDDHGKPDLSENSRQILKLIQEQLR